ncbi:MAG TPA: hypothetical protein VH062_30845 [Polyangiaceae bacterium]|nr:hypothetical protein [Polyangiaceae bacterium]
MGSVLLGANLGCTGSIGAHCNGTDCSAADGGPSSGSGGGNGASGAKGSSGATGSSGTSGGSGASGNGGGSGSGATGNGGVTGGSGATGNGGVVGIGGSAAGTDPIVQPGTAAMIGVPSSTLFNGLLTVLDKSGVVPPSAMDPGAGTMPAELAAVTKPFVPGVKVIAHHDSVVLYFSNVAGAADYRAYVVDKNVTFTTTANGAQPRGAIVACAGYRQHTYSSETNAGHQTRELLQAIELPGFIDPAKYTIILEATKTPCPFVGMPAHTDAQITMDNDGKTTTFHKQEPDTYLYTGIPVAVLRSAATVQSQYGNVILNGQGASISFDTRATAAKIGVPVPPNDPTIPSDPDVIARSALSVQFPFGAASPVFDTGPHSLMEDFQTDMMAPVASIKQNPDYGTSKNPYNDFSMDPLFQMGTWEFWGRFGQGADVKAGTANADVWTPQALLGLQVFVSQGRLHTTFGDSGQDVGGTLSFASLNTPIVEMDSQLYIHSVFRINSEATHRRYWYWTLCGGASSDELFDSTAKQYKLRPIVYETTFNPGGNNPSVPDGHSLESSSTPDDAVGVAKECLSITEEARPEDGTRTDGKAQTSAAIRAQIHPANKSHGIIPLGNKNSDVMVAPDAPTYGFRFRVDKNGKHTGPMIDPYDQLSPLTQYDIFVRPDRLVVFINETQAFCVDMSGIPLTMKSAMIGYGDLLYHSSLEWQEVSDSDTNKNSQLYQYLLNTPIATNRLWDMIGHSDKNDIPAQFGSLDTSTCFKPTMTTVQAFPQ